MLKPKIQRQRKGCALLPCSQGRVEILLRSRPECSFLWGTSLPPEVLASEHLLPVGPRDFHLHNPKDCGLEEVRSHLFVEMSVIN